MNELIANAGKMLRSVKMRDARKYGMIFLGISSVIGAADMYSSHVMENGYELKFSIGKIVTIDLKKPSDKKDPDVIDVTPNDPNSFN